MPEAENTPTENPARPADSRAWVRRHGPETLIGSLIITVVGAVATAALTLATDGGGEGDAKAQTNTTPSVASAATAGRSCTGTACAGLDPKETGCASGARTIAEDWLHTMHAEIRYSDRCGTVWGKMTGAQKGDTLQAATSPHQLQRAIVTEGHTQYTKMLPVGRAYSVAVTAVSVNGDPAAGIPRGATLPISANQDAS